VIYISYPITLDLDSQASWFIGHSTYSGMIVNINL